VSDRFFPYDFDRRYRLIWGPLGARPDVDGVTITGDGRLVATFGRYRVETPVANVKDVKVTGPYRWWKAIGIRGSLVDSGLTFGTTARGGVCILFHDRIPQVIPPNKSHSALTVTVTEREELAAALRPR
jgi:hypothetical protein